MQHIWETFKPRKGKTISVKTFLFIKINTIDLRKDNTFTAAISPDHHSSRARENELRSGDNDALCYCGTALFLIS